ncbi:hypothetical protein FRC17_005872 [Serendipita sp. 399]|nr:hypothetical protein FRC17_005872 [Serendipita sp. 399]
MSLTFQPRWNVRVTPSPNSYGWTAEKKIPAGCLVLEEAPLLTLPSNYTPDQLLAALRQLPTPQIGDAVKFGTSVGVFSFASRLRRGYRPNLFKYWNEGRQLLEYRACRDIRAGEELLSPPFSIKTLLNPHAGRCLLSGTWHTIHALPNCGSCDGVSDSRADQRRAMLTGILFENTLDQSQLPMQLRIDQLHNAIQWLEEEGLEHFRDQVWYMLFKAYESTGDLNNAMLYLTRALNRCKNITGEEDQRVQDLKEEKANLQLRL